MLSALMTARSGISLYRRAYTTTPSCTPTLGTFALPPVWNEPMKEYAKGHADRTALEHALRGMRESLVKNGPFQVPSVINGVELYNKGTTSKQVLPFEHQTTLCTYHSISKSDAQRAIQGALEAKPAWEAMPFNDRAAIFLKAADLLSGKYRSALMSATMLGQGKNVWQAEIDAAAELADFWRFNAAFAAQIYADQPEKHSPGNWNRVEYRALEGFVTAITPFNFTAIGGNLVTAPVLMGNVCLWKPSPMAMYSNYIVYQILKEAGLPDGVIQFLPGDAEMFSDVTLSHPDFAGLHFTGSTHVFKMLWKKIAGHLDVYKSYPRIVGETGGKNMHFIHKSADARQAALQTMRSAFEYNGQKCSACSRVYVPDTLFEEFKSVLAENMPRLVYGPVDDFSHFGSAVINEASFDKISRYIDDVKSGKNASTRILMGGQCDKSVGYYIQPTVLLTTDPKSPTMVDELFGPVVTLYVYPAEQYEETLSLADSSSPYALTCGLFAQDRYAMIQGSNALRNAAGNFYINDKSTGAVVGQQPFGGGRASGTNDKAGSAMNLLRWVSARTIKENFVPIKDFLYPSN